MEIVLALDIGGTQLTVGLASREHKDWIAKERLLTPAGAEADIEIKLLLGLIQRLCGDRRPAGIGISFGGPVDYAAQRVRHSDHVPGWADTPLPAMLAARLGVPAIMDNDANVAALGEYVYGAGQGYQTLFYVTVSTGVGGGWILKGKVWRGTNGMAGEIGHTVVDLAGPLCFCGNRGCVERFASGPYMAQDALQWLADRPGEGAILRQLIAESGASGATISQAAAAGDTIAQALLERGARALGVGLGNAANLIDPELMIIGGGVTKAGRAWWDVVRHTAQKTMRSALTVEIVPAGLGDDAPLWGAVALAWHLLDGKEP